MQKFLAAKPIRFCKRLIQRPWLLPVASMHLAASRIQKAWRSSWLRTAKPSSAIEGRRAPAATPNPWTPPGTSKASQPSAPKRRRGSSAAAAAALKQRHLNHLRRRVELPEEAASGRTVYPTYELFCLAVLQGWMKSIVRVRRVKRVMSYEPLKLYQIAAFEIQRNWRPFHERMQRLDRRTSSPSADDEEAELIRHAKFLANTARKLQNAWRKVCDYRVYETLRDTIGSFRRSGEPYLLLKAVLPRESMLLDPAMQVHVRFRLGGQRFPPTIYYKIYTHGAIVDLCSFAPRNYELERQTNTRGLPGDAGWYEREENNGWRPLTVRLSKTSDRVVDEVEKETSRKRVPNFHHSKLRRRQDVERKRREKSVEWMRKLYGFEGDYIEEASRSQRVLHETTSEWEEVLTSPKGFAAGAPSAIRGAARVAAPSTSIPEHVSELVPRPPPGPCPPGRPARRPGSASSNISEPEVVERKLSADSDPQDDVHKGVFADDMLLAWSRSLNFEAYMEDWQSVATTDGSEGNLPIASKFAAGLVY